MDLSDIKKKFEAARKTSLTRHYKVSIGELTNACLALIDFIEKQNITIKTIQTEPIPIENIPKHKILPPSHFPSTTDGGIRNDSDDYTDVKED
jgi:hypothetical protein